MDETSKLSTAQLRETVRKFMRVDFDSLRDREKELVRRILERDHLSKDTNRTFDEQLSFGQRLADRVATFGGSWTFIVIFLATLLAWVALNTFILARHGKPFDPYPYILLNLFLSMLASLQAPVILMSQNRQAAKDRLDAEHDYEVNLKAELEICSLHDKLDQLREKQWEELVALQRQQLDLLRAILASGKAAGESGRA